MKLFNWFRKKNRLWEDYKNDKATVYKDMDPIVKAAMAHGAMQEAGKLLMFTFISCDLRTHMDCTLVNEATGETFVLIFRKLKNASPMDK